MPRTPLKDTARQNTVGNTILCETYFDRGPESSEYDADLFSTRGSVVTPLDLDVPLGTALAEQYLLFLCNREYALALEKNPKKPPDERPTSRDNVTALTLTYRCMPFRCLSTAK